MNDAAQQATTSLDVNGIMDLIPHRPPFLMIDRVEDIAPGERATGVKNVTINEPFFEGHFPSQPVMPGVLIIEAMAQTAAVTVMSSREPGEALPLVYFMTVETGRFRKPVFPGDTVRLEVARVHSRGNVWKFRGEAKVEGQVRAEAAFSAMIVEQK